MSDLIEFRKPSGVIVQVNSGSVAVAESLGWVRADHVNLSHPCPVEPPPPEARRRGRPPK
jgi:hypothetical protein